ncbi:uncharacterized protein LOC114877914 isoform X2 [Osmia bicornis bicornis]|uniref:uncharacterized protein LOC114877914 isoform X2 n=1 Tax=Osmia bicornis bicornis TaxID=1437191 RepID=UPI001EAF2993|nr:uncharacterized protein LOC114877914 isoform X2 [Osmia bicornis bicornis]
MSARSQRGVHEATIKRFPTPRVNQPNRAPKPAITYDYDAAVSQPDVPDFLNFKKAGRGAMVSGVPLKKRALKTRLRCRIMSRKNFQKRPQTFRPRSVIQRHAKVPDRRYTKKPIASSDVSEEETDVLEKENVTDNGTNIDDSLVYRKVCSSDLSSNFIDISFLFRFEFYRKRFFYTVKITNGILFAQKDAKNVYKDGNETIESIGDNQITGRKEKHEIQDDCDSVTAKSPVLQGKSSKIPRAKTTAFPVQELHSTKKTGNKVKNSTCLNCTSINCAPNVEVLEREVERIANKIQGRSCEHDVVRFEEFQNVANMWNKEESSARKAEEETEDDRGLTSTDDSPAISKINDRRVATILRSLKLNCPCKSCSNHQLPSSSRQEDDSDLKSTSPDESRKKRWPLKHRKYLDTSTEDVDASSDDNDENDKKKKRNRLKAKVPLIQQVKTSSIINTSPKISTRRTSFSFLNTLFDIVFWPYLFLKTNR